MKPFTPHQKRPTKPVVPMKIIRIDGRTQLEVPINMSEEKARERFFGRNKSYYHYPNTPNMPIKEEFKEILVANVEDLEAVVDDLLLPDI